MSKVEQLIREPGVGHQVVRGIIGISPGTTGKITVTSGGKKYVVNATVLRKVGTKLTK